MLHNISEISEIAKRLILAAHHRATIPLLFKAFRKCSSNTL